LWNTVPAQATSNATGLPAGTYTATVTDVGSCTTTISITMTEPTLLTASISSQTNINCNGESNGSATIIASGGTSSYSYLWNTVPVQTSDNASGLSEGSYIVSVTDGNGCAATQTVSIAAPLSITVNSSATGASCFESCNGLALVAVAGGVPTYTYYWQP